jgi:hypothetical protein
MTDNHHQIDKLLRKHAPFLYNSDNNIEPKYSHIDSLLRQWLKKSLKVMDSRTVRTQLKQLCSEMQQQLNSSTATTNRSEEEQVTFLWRELKAEIFELMLGMLGEVGITIYEMRAALDAALHVLQMKERQYRRIPREIIEQIVDRLFPNDNRNRRSLVRFLISELQRLKNHTQYSTPSENETIGTTTTDDEEIVKRTARILAYTVSEIAERFFVPIPRLHFIDDAGTNDNKSTPVHEEDTMNGYSNFSQNIRSLLNWSNQTIDSIVQQTDSIDEKHQNQYSSWFSIDPDSSIAPGRLKIHIPLFRHPTKQLNQISQQYQDRQTQLMQRLERINELDDIFEKSSSSEKSIISLMCTSTYLTKTKRLSQMKALSDHVNILTRGYLAKDKVSTEYDRQIQSVLSRPIKQIQNNESIDEDKTTFRSIISRVSRVSQSDIDELKFSFSNEYQLSIQTQNWSYQFLQALIDQSKRGKRRSVVHFDQFQKLFSVGGSLSNNALVHSIQQHVDSYLAQNNISFQDEESENAAKLRLLYYWIMEGHPSETHLKQLLTSTTMKPQSMDLSNLLLDITKYVTNRKRSNNIRCTTQQWMEYKMNKIEEYCLSKLISNENSQETVGERFIYDVIQSLREQLKYEIVYPQKNVTSSIDQQVQQEEQILQEGAYTYIQLVVKDQYGIDVQLKKQKDSVEQDLYNASVHTLLDNTQKEEDESNERAIELEYGQSFAMLKNSFIQRQERRSAVTDDTHQLLQEQMYHESQMQREQLLLSEQRDRSSHWIRSNRKRVLDIISSNK